MTELHKAIKAHQMPEDTKGETVSLVIKNCNHDGIVFEVMDFNDTGVECIMEDGCCQDFTWAEVEDWYLLQVTEKAIEYN